MMTISELRKASAAATNVLWKENNKFVSPPFLRAHADKDYRWIQRRLQTPVKGALSHFRRDLGRDFLKELRKDI